MSLTRMYKVTRKKVSSRHTPQMARISSRLSDPVLSRWALEATAKVPKDMAPRSRAMQLTKITKGIVLCSITALSQCLSLQRVLSSISNGMRQPHISHGYPSRLISMISSGLTLGMATLSHDRIHSQCTYLTLPEHRQGQMNYFLLSCQVYKHILHYLIRCWVTETLWVDDEFMLDLSTDQNYGFVCVLRVFLTFISYYKINYS